LLYRLLQVYVVILIVTSVCCYTDSYKCMLLYRLLQVYVVILIVTSVCCYTDCYKCMLLYRLLCLQSGKETLKELHHIHRITAYQLLYLIETMCSDLDPDQNLKGHGHPSHLKVRVHMLVSAI